MQYIHKTVALPPQMESVETEGTQSLRGVTSLITRRCRVKYQHFCTQGLSHLAKDSVSYAQYSFVIITSHCLALIGCSRSLLAYQ